MTHNELVLSLVPVLKSNNEFRCKCELEGSPEVQSCVEDSWVALLSDYDSQVQLVWLDEQQGGTWGENNGEWVWVEVPGPAGITEMSEVTKVLGVGQSGWNSGNGHNNLSWNELQEPTRLNKPANNLT
jgi:hypothetical protein